MQVSKSFDPWKLHCLSLATALLSYFVLTKSLYVSMKLKKFFYGKMDRWLDGMVLPWTNEMKVTLDDIVSARGQPNSLF